ncbi:hypothetical protein [Ralstonia holmesii]|uniref:hypothetical protein n=1 Tax=Ralstonia holmesii TaxID=3058602 RepID=UPI0028F530D0|nr:hypothetical protein [Ralstonia sp. LMG 32967]CAJ0698810.1 hypothetical protein R11007_02893 [Ralstonia sp. LMG 32967]
MSFIYPRTIKITRQAPVTAVGAVQYSAVQASQEVNVATGISASIQLDKTGRKPDANLPADIAGRTFWRVLIPLGQAALGLIQLEDVITDDLGVRYQVVGPYWNSLGYNLLVDRLGT